MFKPCFKLWQVLPFLGLMVLTSKCCEAGGKVQPKTQQTKPSREEVQKEQVLRQIEKWLSVPPGVDPADAHYVIVFYDRAGRLTQSPLWNDRLNRPFFDDEAQAADSHKLVSGQRQAAESILEFRAQPSRSVQKLRPTLRPHQTRLEKCWDYRAFKTYGEAAAFAAALESPKAS